MKVKALSRFEHVLDSTIGRTRKKGEVFEVSKERADVLFKNGLIQFVNDEPTKEEKMAELAKAIDEADKPKRGRKKKS